MIEALVEGVLAGARPVALIVISSQDRGVTVTVNQGNPNENFQEK